MSQLPAPRSEEPSATQQDHEQIPLETRRVFDSCQRQFIIRLSQKAGELTRDRGSRTPTDADVNEAYRQLTQKSKSSKASRCIGSGLTVAGGITIGSSWKVYSDSGLGFIVILFTGLLLSAAGIYIRDWVSPN